MLTYDTNITGFVKGHSNFYNISPLANQTNTAPLWAPAAGALLSHVNTTFNATESLELFGSWSWQDTEKVTLSVVEKLPSTLENYTAPEYERDTIALIHVSPAL